MKKDIIVLHKWEQAKQAILECKNIDEVKQIRDKAQALMAYVKQAREGLEVQNNVAEIKLRAERRIGEFSKALPISPGKRTDLTSSHDGKRLILKKVGVKHYERYEAIANLSEEIFEEYIQQEKAGNKELTTAGILQRIKQAKMVESHKRKHNELTLPTGKFNVILADPPWQYDHPISKNRKIERHYPTMSLEDICNIPVKNIFSKDAILFLWVTSPMLEKGLKVLNEWGFSYRTCLVWVKHHHGMGQWVLQKHELLLIGVKGNLFTPLKKPVSVIEHPRGKHSEKPQLYEMIEAMYPNGTYLELFHRGEKRKNWTGWGDESGTIYRRP